MARHHRSLESPATAICRDARPRLERRYRGYDVVYGWCDPGRYSSRVVFKTSLSVGSGTMHNWCLVSSGRAISGRNTESSLEISVFGQSIRPTLTLDEREIKTGFPFIAQKRQGGAVGKPEPFPFIAEK